MIPLKSHTPENALLNTISYFSFFKFTPDFEEIYMFYPKKISKKGLKTLLDKLVRQKKVIKSCLLPQTRFAGFLPSDPEGRNDKLEHYNKLNKSLFQIKNFKLKIDLYTLPQYPNLFDMTIQRRKNTWKKLTSIYRYIETVKKIPFIQFAGLTGSASMGNCKVSDDVDLFIITTRNYLFIGRFFAVLFAHILNVRKGKNSVCLNLFFDESNITIPKPKQTSYVAHEVLQMKPIIDKNNTYERFLKSNKWVYKFFPNTRSRHPDENRDPKLNRFRIKSGMTCVLLLLWPVEFILKTIQLAIIRKNKTALIISPTQLWLFKKDFEKKIKRPIL